MFQSQEIPKRLPPSQTAERFIIRLPDGLRDRIARVAKQNRRSMNQEIVLHLLRAMGDDNGANLEVLHG